MPLAKGPVYFSGTSPARVALQYIALATVATSEAISLLVALPTRGTRSPMNTNRSQDAAVFRMSPFGHDMVPQGLRPFVYFASWFDTRVSRVYVDAVCMYANAFAVKDGYIYIYICNWIVVVIASRVTDRSFAARLDVTFRIGYLATERQCRAFGLLTHSDISLCLLVSALMDGGPM